MNQVTPENWNYSHYKSLNLKAFITIGGQLSQESQVETLFSVTVTENEESEILQKDFDDLGVSCDFINERYGHWEYVSLLKSSSGSGCDSCSAH